MSLRMYKRRIKAWGLDNKYRKRQAAERDVHGHQQLSGRSPIGSRSQVRILDTDTYSATPPRPVAAPTRLAAAEALLQHLGIWVATRFHGPRADRQTPLDRHAHFRHESQPPLKAFQTAISAIRAIINRGCIHDAGASYRRAMRQVSSLMCSWDYAWPIFLMQELVLSMGVGGRPVAFMLQWHLTAMTKKTMNSNDTRRIIYNVFQDLELLQDPEIHLRSRRCLLEALAAILGHSDSMCNERLDSAWSMMETQAGFVMGGHDATLASTDKTGLFHDQYSIGLCHMQLRALMIHELYSDAEVAAEKLLAVLEQQEPGFARDCMIADIHRHLGIMYLRQGHDLRARECFMTALQLCDTCWSEHYFQKFTMVT